MWILSSIVCVCVCAHVHVCVGEDEEYDGYRLYLHSSIRNVQHIVRTSQYL